VQNMRNHLLTALGGHALRFSEDGCKAYLEFGSALAAVQARTVCEQACCMLRDQMEATPMDALVVASTSLEQPCEEEAPPRQEAMRPDTRSSWSNLQQSHQEAPAQEQSLAAPQSLNMLQYVHGDLMAQISFDAPHSTMRPDTRSSWSHLHSLGAPASFAPHALAPHSSMVQAPASGAHHNLLLPVSPKGPGSSCSSHSVHSGFGDQTWTPTYVSC
jgi:hypothetical protein